MFFMDAVGMGIPMRVGMGVDTLMNLNGQSVL